MAKFVIAGHADCPYYARAELLGDTLAINLPDFKVHKIVKTSDEWQKWLPSVCQERGWNHNKSPLIWRELIDRGGKGVLIGDANEFQEYAKGYYGIESKLNSSDMRKIGTENQKCKTEVDKEEADFKALSRPLHICITNAATGMCYTMLDSLARGEVLGCDVELIIHLLDTAEKKEYLEGVKMEAEDLAYGLLRGVVVESDIKTAFKNCELIVLLDEIPQGEKSKDDWIKDYSNLFTNYAKVIDEVAKKTVKVLVAGSGPVNFCTYMMVKHATTIPRQNFVAMSRVIENRAKAIIAQRLKVNSAGVVDLLIWGNPNGEHYIDVENSRVHGYDGAIIGPNSFSVSVPEMVFDRKWLETEYLELVKNKASQAEEAMKHPATMSWGSAINSTLRHWFQGSPSGQMFSLGICSEGWYGIPKDLVFSFPVTFHPKGYWNVVQDIDLSQEVKAKIHATIQDLEAEIEVIYPKPKPPTPEVTQESLASEGNNTNNAEDKKEDADQRLETIVEEKKETSEEEAETTATTEGEKTETEESQKEGEKTEAEVSQKEGERTEESQKEGEKPEEGQKTEEPATADSAPAEPGTNAEEQLPTA